MVGINNQFTFMYFVNIAMELHDNNPIKKEILCIQQSKR